MLRSVRAVLALVWLVVIPTVAYAQASIVGTVMDASGAAGPLCPRVTLASIPTPHPNPSVVAQPAGRCAGAWQEESHPQHAAGPVPQG